MLPEVSDHAAVQYLKRVLGEDTDALRVELSMNGVEVVSDRRVLEYMLGSNETEKLKGEISKQCELDFIAPGQGNVLILHDKCNFVLNGKAGIVKTCLGKEQVVKFDPVTVVERTTRGMKLGRMAVQPPPISYAEEEECKARIAAYVRRSLNGSHP